MIGNRTFINKMAQSSVEKSTSSFVYFWHPRVTSFCPIKKSCTPFALFSIITYQKKGSAQESRLKNYKSTHNPSEHASWFFPIETTTFYGNLL